MGFRVKNYGVTRVELKLTIEHEPKDSVHVRFDVTMTELQDLYDLAETGPYEENAYLRLEDVLSLFSMARTRGAELAIHLKDDKDGLEIALLDLATTVENRIEESYLLESIFVFDVSIDSAQRFAEIGLPPSPRCGWGSRLGKPNSFRRSGIQLCIPTIRFGRSKFDIV